MPELPEVEVLARHLGPLLQGRTVRGIEVRRPKVLRPTTVRRLTEELRGATFTGLCRRGKYLVFTLTKGTAPRPVQLLGHLGMTGRMYLLPATAPLPKHTAVLLKFGQHNFVFEDTRYFGRLTLDCSALKRLGPEPLGDDFTPESFGQSLKSSAQPIKIKLLDQKIVAGIGNIYASEALFRAGISPRIAARRLSRAQIQRLWQTIREVLAEAIELGSTVPLDYSGTGERDGLFYFGRAANALDFYSERLHVYDRAAQPCDRCGTAVKRLVQAGRSTFYCPTCQRT